MLLCSDWLEPLTYHNQFVTLSKHLKWNKSDKIVLNGLFDLDLMWNIIIQLWVYRLSESRFVPLAGFHFQNDQIMVRAKHQFVAILSCVRCKSAETEHLTWNYITVTWLWTYHAVMCCRLEVIHTLFDQIQVILSRWLDAQGHLGMRTLWCHRSRSVRRSRMCGLSCPFNSGQRILFFFNLISSTKLKSANTTKATFNRILSFKKAGNLKNQATQLYHKFHKF